jgi:hypothetical protein
VGEGCWIVEIGDVAGTIVLSDRPDIQLVNRCPGLQNLRLGFDTSSLSNFCEGAHDIVPRTAQEVMARYRLEEVLLCGKSEEISLYAWKGRSLWGTLESPAKAGLDLNERVSVGHLDS